MKMLSQTNQIKVRNYACGGSASFLGFSLGIEL